MAAGREEPCGNRAGRPDVRSRLERIANGYECVFSWDMRARTGAENDIMLKIADKIRESCEMMAYEHDAFNSNHFNRFSLQFIICYEKYNKGAYKESLSEIENVVKTIESCIFDETNQQYTDAWKHIVRSTYAYIAITLNLDSEKIMENVKPVGSLNLAEKALICAVKSRVFSEYAPIGTVISLKFAEQAYNFQSTQPEWIITWLIAKGRVRRQNGQRNIPEQDEIDAARILSKTKSNPVFLLKATKIFISTAINYTIINKNNEADELYWTSSKLLLTAAELAKDNIKQLHSCLIELLKLPTKYHTKSIKDKLISKLTNVNNNSRIDEVLGEYYLKHEKDFEKSKMHLSRGMAAGNFYSALLLVKLECLLQHVSKFPLVPTLETIYDIFQSPNRRLIVLRQILIYYFYYENNPREMMRYLKLYLDQGVDDMLKKRNLRYVIPLFKVDGYDKNNNFLEVLSLKVEFLANHYKWSNHEKATIYDTMKRFNIMSQVNIKNVTNAVNEEMNEGNWRKRQIDNSNSAKLRDDKLSWRTSKK